MSDVMERAPPTTRTIRIRLPNRTYRRLQELKLRLDASDYGEVMRRAIQEMEERLDARAREAQ